MDVKWIGRIDYLESIQLQESLVKKRQLKDISDTILLLEHNEVYTIGRTKDKSSLLNANETKFPIIETNRGGQATFHGPGQLIGYLILDLNSYGKDLHIYLREIESILLSYTRSININSNIKKGLTGVWANDKKLCSIGIGVKRWISMHGFSINVSDNLDGYKSIIPCGISKIEMTSISKEINKEIKVSSVANNIKPFIESSLNKLRNKFK